MSDFSKDTPEEFVEDAWYCLQDFLKAHGDELDGDYGKDIVDILRSLRDRAQHLTLNVIRKR